MKKLKVMTVFGTRPEAIKMCPLVLELRKHPDTIEPIVAVTAQHREMLDQVLELFGIVPDYDLNIMKGGQTLYDVTTRALQGLKEVMEEARPDLVLVTGIRRRLLPAHLPLIICRFLSDMWKPAFVPATSTLPSRKK
jgi:UDP-N-acetylglucosamine 2-epimerase (non-hydrolysing)